jgi:hypothetical protein
MRATLDGQRIFSGWVDDIAVDHDGNGRVSTVTFTVSDGLARLPDDLTWMPEVEEPGGTRAARLLARAGWGGQSLIVAGSHTMNTAEQSGGVLDQLNALAQGEQGLVYASVDNVLVFLTSSSFVNPSSARTFTDSGSGTYRYASLDEQSSVDVLVTQVEVDYGAAEPLVQGDGEAVSLYGLFTESHQVPFRDESGARAFADQVLAEFAAPVPRFRSMLVPTVRFAQPVREAIFGTDLGTVVTVQRSPLGSGSPTTVSRDCVVVGVEHEISDGGQYAQTGFTLRTVNTATYFTLDSSTLDGSHVLAY